jgi:hypothetical protein
MLEANATIVVDDSTGSAAGIALSAEINAALGSADLLVAAPPRGENAKAGNAATPGTKTANATQQDYFVEVATTVVLPIFKARDRPFVLVFWSRDPGGTQHKQFDLSPVTKRRGSSAHGADAPPRSRTPCWTRRAMGDISRERRLPLAHEWVPGDGSFVSPP